MKSSSRSRLSTYLTLLTVVAIGAGAYFFVFYPPRPCVNPIAFRIGKFDTQFGISREDFLLAAEEGSSVWSKAIGKILFVSDPKGKLVVNLIFDKRQAETQQQFDLEKQIGSSESIYKEKKASLDVLQGEYERASVAYEDLLRSFKNATADYQSKVSYWNRRGGAPKSEYDSLSSQKQALVSLQQDLESKRLALNALAQSVNTLVAEVNVLAREANAKVHEYNSSDLIGVAFDQGLYVRDASGTSINIYQFKDKQKLVRVLAHEFGHALGLDHNNNPQSIMYEFNQGDTEKVSQQDLVSLRTLCQVTSKP